MIKEEVFAYLTKIRSSKSEEERKLRRNELDDWFYTLSPQEQAEARDAIDEDMKRVGRELKAIREEVELLMKDEYKAA